MTVTERDALCRRLAAAISGSVGPGDADPLAEVAAALPPLSTAAPAVGQLWRANRCTGHEQALVLLTHVSGAIRAVLVSEDTWIAASDDLLVQPGESPTGRALVVAVWSDTAVPTAALQGLIGLLPTGVTKPLLMLLQRQLTGGFRLRAVETVSQTETAAVRWSISQAGDLSTVHEFTTGSRICDALDGRQVVRTALRAATAWLAQDAAAEALRLGAAPEPVPWQTRLRSGFSDAISALGGAIGDEARPTFGSAVPGVAAGAGGFGPFPRLLAGTGLGAAELRNAVGERPVAVDGTGSNATVPLTFSVPIGAASVSGRIDFRGDRIDLLVTAHSSGTPKRGIPIRLLVGEGKQAKSHSARTDGTGIALLRDVHVEPGAGVELTLGRNAEARSVKLS